jgi:hypothetical protein
MGGENLLLTLNIFIELCQFKENFLITQTSPIALQKIGFNLIPMKTPMALQIGFFFWSMKHPKGQP